MGVATDPSLARRDAPRSQARHVDAWFVWALLAPNGSVGQVVVFAVATAVFWAVAYRVFRPLLTTNTKRTR